MNLVEAQLLILQQLCCASAHHNVVDYDRDLAHEWNIPGANKAVDQVVSCSLNLVCTGRLHNLHGEQSGGQTKGLLDDPVIRSFIVQRQPTTDSSGESIAAATTTTTTSALPPVLKDHWRHILLVTRAVTGLLSAGWHPLPQGIDRENVILALLVIASRGIKLDDLYASPRNSSNESREERLVASSCAAEALSSLVHLAKRGLIPVKLQEKLVRTIIRLNAIIEASDVHSESSAGNPLFGIDQPSDMLHKSSSREEKEEIEHQVEFFTSQREACLSSTVSLLWTLVTEEYSMEESISAFFFIMDTANQVVDDRAKPSASTLDNILKWNDRAHDYVLADCAGVIRIFSSALWGEEEGEYSSGSSHLRIFWHPAIEAICTILSNLYSRFVLLSNKDKDKGGITAIRAPLVASNYFTNQVRPLVTVSIAALEKAVHVELGNGILSALDWDAIIGGLENSVLPWLSYEDVVAPAVSSNTSIPPVLVPDTGHILREVKSLLLTIAELLAEFVRHDTAPLTEYSMLRTLFLLLLHHSCLLGEQDAEIVGIAVVQAWGRFGFFPYRLSDWAETASELLREAFARRQGGAFVHSAVVRTEVLEYLTWEDTDIEEDENEEGMLKPQSLLTMTHCMRGLYQEIVSGSLLPVLKVILTDGAPDQRDLLDNSGKETAGIDRLQMESSEACTDLALYAVRLVGRLFFSLYAGDREQRSDCVALLRCAATTGPCAGSNTSTLLRLEAQRQLVHLLNGIFCCLPRAHECIPLLIDALCAVVEDSVEHLLNHPECTEIGLAAADVLESIGRLRLFPQKKLAFLPDPLVMKELPVLAAIRSEDRNETCQCDILVAAFVSVGDATRNAGVSSDRTVFSFLPLADAMFATLGKLNRCAPVQDKGKTANAICTLLRKSCLDVLCHLLRSGVVLDFRADVVKLISNSLIVESDTGPQSGEAMAATRALSLFAQLRLANQRNQPPDSISLLKLLLAPSPSSEPERAIRSFRSLHYILVFSSDIGELDSKKIFCLLLGFVSSGDDQRASIVFTLLCLLSENLSSRPRLNDSALAMKALEICLNIISKSHSPSKRYVVHLALRCALKMIRQFTPDERETAKESFCTIFEKFLLIGPKGDCDSVEEEFSPLVLKEALTQPVAAFSEMLEVGQPAGAVSSLSRHQALTLQSEQINRFVVAAEIPGKFSPCASWLCNDNVILTCRVGCPSSRFGGYLEVCLRSPLARKRCLIPIPGKALLDHPDFPSQLFFAPCSARPEEGEAAHEHECAGDCDTFDPESTAVLDHAQSLLDRFDTMFAEGSDCGQDSQLGIDSEDEGSTQDLLENDEDFSSVATDGTSFLTVTVESATATTHTQSENILHPRDDEGAVNLFNLEDSTLASSDCLDVRPQDQTVKGWILSVFGWNAYGVREQVDKHLQPHHLYLSGSDKENSCFGDYLFREGKRLCYNSKLERALTILDRTTPSNTYKFGLLYFGRPQLKTNESTKCEKYLLGNLACSPSFHKFASGLGSMTSTRHLKYYSAGLDVSNYESDGRYALAWSAPDGTSVVVYHVAHLMPPGLNGRKRHVGNDNILIVFIDESSERDPWLYSSRGVNGDATSQPVVSGHFNHATIFVRRLPTDSVGLFRVSCRKRADLRPDLDEVLSVFCGDDLVGEAHVADFVRNLAVRADIACRTLVDGLAEPTNCLERCQQIAEMKRYTLH